MFVITNWRDLDHPDAGGAEVVCQELARRFAASGEDVVLRCAAVGGRPRSEVRQGYKILRAGGRYTVYPRALVWLLANRRSVTAVIDSQNGIPFFTPLAVSRRTPIVMLMHHIHQDQFAKYLPRPAAMLGRWLESSASRRVYGRHAVVAVSPSTRDGVRRRLRLRGDVWVAPPAWSVSEQVRLAPISRSEQPSVVCVGRLVPHKRIGLIVESFGKALKSCPDATLTIVGRGPELAYLSSLAANSGVEDRIAIRSDLDDDDRDRLMSTAWLTVNASEGEGWGLSVVEANALGVPALAFRRPGLRDSIVDGKTGWLLEDGDDLGQAMANCLNELRDPDRASSLAHQCRRWAESFSWEAMTDRVRTVLVSEAARLSRGLSDRRTPSDLGTLITFPTKALPSDWQSRVRASDTWTADDGFTRALCRGADTQAAEVLLRRLGLVDRSPSTDTVKISVARGVDLLYGSSQSADFRG